MSKYRKISLVLFIIYIGFVLWVTIFSREPVSGLMELRHNRPLWMFHSYHWLFTGNFAVLPNLYLNVLFFIPFGFLLTGVIGNTKIYSFIIAFFSALFLSALVETIQFKFNLGVFEIDDIINNTLGSAIGFFFMKLAIKIFNKDIFK